jgi:hypothetical protein
MPVDKVEKACSGNPSVDRHSVLKACVLLMRTNASREKTTGTVDPGFANGVGMANAENDLDTREASANGFRIL